MNSEVLIRVHPKPLYWLNYLWVMPLAGLVFTAIIGGAIADAAGLPFTAPMIFTGWAVMTLVLIAWALFRDLSHPHYALTPSALQLGRGAAATAIPFGEIQSIVVQLPARVPWWLRLLRFHPHGWHAHKAHMTARANTALLRLHDQRYLPLCLSFSSLANGPQLMEKFLFLNKDKIVGHDTYTPEEIQRLQFVRVNRIFSL